MKMVFRFYLERIKKWLNGEFQCLKCNRTFYLMSFGYGKAICPSCYEGENPFIYFQDPIMRKIMRGLYNEKTI